MPAMIVAPQPMAVEEGAKVLAGGGNAFDAAVTAAVVQGVIDPHSCGLGGYLVLTAKAVDFQDGFDDWVEDWDMLQRYFQEAEWEVAWLE